MFTGFDLSKLPSLPWLQKERLPNCSAVYFAVDSKNRVLYVGKATNLLTRWKDHHRFEQLNQISRKNPIKLAWLVCTNEQDLLSKTEAYFIKFYQPLLNKTPVPAKKIIPSEIALQQTLSKILKYVVILGFEPGKNSLPLTVYLKYPVISERRGRAGTIRSILKLNNKRATGLKWQEYSRRRFSFWKASCNGVVIDVGPCEIWPSPECLLVQNLAGIEMLAVREPNFTQILRFTPLLKKNSPGLSVLEYDPVPLLWSKH